MENNMVNIYYYTLLALLVFLAKLAKNRGVKGPPRVFLRRKCQEIAKIGPRTRFFKVPATLYTPEIVLGPV